MFPSEEQNSTLGDLVTSKYAVMHLVLGLGVKIYAHAH